MKRLHAALAALVTAAAFAGCTTTTMEKPSLGTFEAQGDIGDTAFKGSASYDAATKTYSVTGGGANIWYAADAFHYVWKKMPAGDLHIAADISFATTTGIPHKKAGLMIRQDLTPGSPYVDVAVHGNGFTAMQWREDENGPSNEIAVQMLSPTRVRLEREGEYAYVSVAGPDGVLHHAGGNVRIKLTGPYYVGLGVSGHDNKVTETAFFKNVEMYVPKLADVPDPGYPAKVESTIEILDVASGNRRVAFQLNTGKLEAPNWSRDGKFLVYNGGGKLWKLPIDASSNWSEALKSQGEPVMIASGNYVKLNNDHVLSPDGKMIAFSDQTQADNVSRIYIMPIDGSDKPTPVVADKGGFSWLHAWTPDAKAVVFTGNRVDKGKMNVSNYDIWMRPIKGGKERDLTKSPGLDDGADFSADGKWLYWNSVRSGQMQIWRSYLDGTHLEHPIVEDRRDWFAHPSPDGKWIVYVSFANDVPLDDHPPNRNVELRIVPADFSAPPRVLAKLFGGQGTMNVPSWSPDSKQIAFVSYRFVR
jgi:TolB protein